MCVRIASSKTFFLIGLVRHKIDEGGPITPGVVGRSMVGQGVGNDHSRLVQIRMGTPESVSGPFAVGPSSLRFTPFAVPVERADRDHRHVACMRGQMDEIFERLVRFSIQHAGAKQCFRPLLLVLGCGAGFIEGALSRLLRKARCVSPDKTVGADLSDCSGIPPRWFQ